MLRVLSSRQFGRQALLRKQASMRDPRSFDLRNYSIRRSYSKSRQNRVSLENPPKWGSFGFYQNNRPYHSRMKTEEMPYLPQQRSILDRALIGVPRLGFSTEALREAVVDKGWSSVALNMFPDRAFDMVRYYCERERLRLKDSVVNNGLQESLPCVESLVLERLSRNVETGVVSKWHEAIGLLSLAENLSTSTSLLYGLADEILHLSGDRSVDEAWYLRRGSLAVVYACAELYQLQDSSVGFSNTQAFVKRRVREMMDSSKTFTALESFLTFTAIGLINQARSKGFKL